MEPEELRQRVSKIQWFHTIDLGHGIITPGVDNTPEKLKKLALPDDFTGKTVLDIGAWDGFFSFEVERRGAKKVLAVDSFCWSGPGWGTKAGFELAREALGSQVLDMEMEVMDLSPEAVGRFDVTLFLGVLYHMKYPFLALERVANVTNELLVLETEVDLLGVSRPAVAFYAGSELNQDPTNWWGPNPKAVCHLLRAAGFKRIEIVSRPASLFRRFLRTLKQTMCERNFSHETFQRARLVVHAWKT